MTRNPREDTPKPREFPAYGDRPEEDPRLEVERLLDEVRAAINEGLDRIQQAIAKERRTDDGTD